MILVSPVCPVIVAHLDRMPLLVNLVTWVNLDKWAHLANLGVMVRLAVPD